MPSPDDCEEELKLQLKALRKKYGGDCVSFMNRVCELEEITDPSDRPDPSLRHDNPRRFRLNLDDPDDALDTLAFIYASPSYLLHRPFNLVEERNQEFDEYDFSPRRNLDPRPFLWMLRQQFKLEEKEDFYWYISKSSPGWASLLTKHLPDDFLQYAVANCEISQSRDTSACMAFEIWAQGSSTIRVEINVHLTTYSSNRYARTLRHVDKVIRSNRVNHLGFQGVQFGSPWFRDNVIEPLKELQHNDQKPKLESLRLVIPVTGELQNTDEYALVEMFRGLVGMKSMTTVYLSGGISKVLFDCLMGDILSHSQCQISRLTLDTKQWLSRLDSIMLAKELQTILHNCPTICTIVTSTIFTIINAHEGFIGFEEDLPQPIQSYFITLQQNRAGRALLQPARFERISNHGIFAIVLEKALRSKLRSHEDAVDGDNTRPTRKNEFLYDGSYYMIRELAERRVGRFGEIENGSGKILTAKLHERNHGSNPPHQKLQKL